MTEQSPEQVSADQEAKQAAADQRKAARLARAADAGKAASHTEEMIAALTAHGDQARTAEREIAPGLTVTVGIRGIYFNADGEVFAVPVVRAD